ncbi:MAG: hypothetical protein MZW92_71145 [Comamonadaceae bacterium]|nr:hypothetical protein [Comamonadaceae bacterium]
MAGRAEHGARCPAHGIRSGWWISLWMSSATALQRVPSLACGASKPADWSSSRTVRIVGYRRRRRRSMPSPSTASAAGTPPSGKARAWRSRSFRCAARAAATASGSSPISAPSGRMGGRSAACSLVQLLPDQRHLLRFHLAGFVSATRRSRPRRFTRST